MELGHSGGSPRAGTSRAIHARTRGSSMRIQQEKQINPVSDEVLALVAVVRPIITGLLYSLKADVANQAGGRENLTLELLTRLYAAGDGDVGICFEYAIHDAISRGDTMVLERMESALKLCKIKGDLTKSILFGAEKSGALQLIDTAHEALTDDSLLLTGTPGRPIKLKKQIAVLAAAFKNPRTRLALPYSISGLWKADLFVGRETDNWVGTTIKTNPASLQGGRGLRIGIIPAAQGRTDRVRKDESRNLIICPLLYDQSFMELFYAGWGIVRQFCAARGNVPTEVALPLASHRQVAKELASRRTFRVLDVIDALEAIAQPELLETKDKTVGLEVLQGEAQTEMVLAPLSKKVT